MATITDESWVGKRVRNTFRTPRRGAFVPAATYVYEGTVRRVRDVAAGAGREWRRFVGEYHVTLADVTLTTTWEDGSTDAVETEGCVLLGHEHGWEEA